ncbi:hypothetical protein [Streptacidiphilus monticola]|uniref:Peptidoglycan-binding protein n=1 Tax=Streptacidiphilus monticola TaxID=2161674 RepID=A0ABW1FY36_9ACTN
MKELTTAEKVHDAFDKLGAGHAITVDLQLRATADQLLALDAQDPSGGPKLTRAQAEQMAGIGITVAVSSDKPVKDALQSASADTGKLDPSLNMDLTVHSGTGAVLAEVRAVSGKEYLKLDFAALSEIGPSDQGSAGDLADLRSMSASLPPSMGALKNLLQGKWVSIDPAKFASFSKSLQSSGSGSGTNAARPSAAPSLDAAQQKKLTDALTGVFEKDVHLTDKGTKDGIDTVELKAGNTRTLLADVQKQVFPVLKSIPGFPGGLPTSAPTGVPTTPAVATLGIDTSSGTLSSVALDAGQFDTKHPGTHLPLVLGFKDTAAAVSAPAGAVEFDPASLGDMMSGLVGGSDTAPLN